MQRAENANPSMLAWGRQAAGLSEEQAAGSVGLSASGRSTAVEGRRPSLDVVESRPAR